MAGLGVEYRAFILHFLILIFGITYIPSSLSFSFVQRQDTDTETGDYFKYFSSDKLRKLGFRVDLNPVRYINYCVFEILGYQVFRCNIRNLSLNTECESDPVAARAVQACLAASERLWLARHHFWLWRLIDEAAFNTNLARDTWTYDSDIKYYPSCLDCVCCCGILTTKTDVEKKVPNIKEITQDLLYDLSGEMALK